LHMPSGEALELAYRLIRRAWGHGIATEAAAALIDHAFNGLGLSRLVAVTYPENRASQRVLDKLGFTRHEDVDYKGVRAAYYVLARDARAGAAATPSAAYGKILPVDTLPEHFNAATFFVDRHVTEGRGARTRFIVARRSI